MADLIHAETDHQRKQALKQLDGNLMKQFDDWRTKLIKIMANIEAYIDFAESEDIEDDVMKDVRYVCTFRIRSRCKKSRNKDFILKLN